MNIKKTKIILNDEVKQVVSIIDKENNNSSLKNNYESKVNK